MVNSFAGFVGFYMPGAAAVVEILETTVPGWLN